MLPLVKLAAAAATTVLTVSSGKNMFQTATIAHEHNQRPSSYFSSATSSMSTLRPGDSTNAIVSKMQAMKRKELLELYFCSRAPQDFSEIQGEWDGILLDNGSWIMTTVTSLLTDRLFGMGRKWNGKHFGIAESNVEENSSKQQRQGINRFYARKTKSNVSSSSSSSSPLTERQHIFDMRLQPSQLDTIFKNSRVQQQQQQPRKCSLVLDYSKHQSLVSPWRTMMDEIRIVPLNGDCRVLIGLGYMAWSGGRLNSSPFLLFRGGTERTTTMAPII